VRNHFSSFFEHFKQLTTQKDPVKMAIALICAFCAINSDEALSAMITVQELATPATFPNTWLGYLYLIINNSNNKPVIRGIAIYTLNGYIF
jgi:hypothetical protein